MNRRSFFTKLGMAAVGVCAAVNLPTSWLSVEVKRESATKMLIKAYNDYAKGRGWKNLRDMNIYVGKDLFDSFSAEFNHVMRFSLNSDDSFKNALCFKTARLKSTGRSGWDIQIVVPEKGEWFQDAAGTYAAYRYYGIIDNRQVAVPCVVTMKEYYEHNPELLRSLDKNGRLSVIDLIDEYLKIGPYKNV